MKKKIGKRRLQFGIAGLLSALIFILISLAGCAGSEPVKSPQEGEPPPRIILSDNMPSGDRSQLAIRPKVVAGLSPLKPQPADTSLVPGLAVEYFKNYQPRDLIPLSNAQSRYKKGKRGKPIPFLNHKFGMGERIFDSRAIRKVAMRMQGLVHFSQGGSYTLLGLSNDGLRIYIADQLIVDDPGVHGDRYSASVIIKITQAGWYPMKVEYFQRKNTAAIGFFWRRPGSNGFEPVPAEAYAHIPGPGQ